MKIIYLIDTKKYPYHTNVIKDFIHVIDGEIVDIATVNDLGSTYYSIEEYGPRVIIAFDLVGHSFRTGSGTLSLNGIYCRIANVLFQKVQVYGNDIRLRQNLSSFMYITERDDLLSVRENCSELPNIEYMKEITYKASTDEEHEENQSIIRNWWLDFKKEAMINEDTNI